MLKAMKSNLYLFLLFLVATSNTYANEVCYSLAHGENGRGSSNITHTPILFTSGSHWPAFIYLTNVSFKPLNIKIEFVNYDASPYLPRNYELHGQFDNDNSPLNILTGGAILKAQQSAFVRINDDNASAGIIGKITWQADSCLDNPLSINIRNEQIASNPNDLEYRLAQQEAKIEELSSTVTEQATEIEALRTTADGLLDVLNIDSDSGNPFDEPLELKRSEPNFDSGWFRLAESCKTYEFIKQFDGLPSQVTAFYRLTNGEILTWGMNQYGDSYESNGVIIDFDEWDRAFVRLPCGNRNSNNNVHIGSYRNRNDNGSDVLYHQQNVDFRIMIWE